MPRERSGRLGEASGVSDLHRMASPHLQRWCSAWGVAGLADDLRVITSTRLRTSLGLCVPARRELRIASFLLAGPPELLLEVVCHEAAHAAVYELHGRCARPHGVEWRALMKAAGYAPRARLAAAGRTGAPPIPTPRILWEHRCPVCQAHRLAGRPVREWRCSACRGIGFAGELTITRREVGPAP